MKVLIVDDEPSILKTLKVAVASFGYDVVACTSPLDALEVARSDERAPELALIDLKMYPIDGIDLMRRLLLLIPSLTPIIITAHGTIDSAVSAVKRGAFDYLQKPFELDELGDLLERARSFHDQRTILVSGTRGDPEGDPDIITSDPRMLELIGLARKAAPTPLPILIEGESGTGKELFARLIHRTSDRQNQSFVRVNCAALPENLLESELFGHVKGSFTGAHADREGRFAVADGGTIFLDEIGEVTPAVQAKLLRVLQEGEFERVGESATQSVDVRVVSATNRHLKEEVGSGRFREDLYYRLAGVRLEIPPLRERKGDVGMILSAILGRLAGEAGGREVSPEVISALIHHEWPGNVRELQNVVSRAYYLGSSGVITLEDLPEELRTGRGDAQVNEERLEEIERAHIRQVIADSETLEEAARRLGIDPATLWRKRKKYDL